MDLIEISGGNYENPKMFDGVRESTKNVRRIFRLCSKGSNTRTSGADRNRWFPFRRRHE